MVEESTFDSASSKENDGVIFVWLLLTEWVSMEKSNRTLVTVVVLKNCSNSIKIKLQLSTILFGLLQFIMNKEYN